MENSNNNFKPQYMAVYGTLRKGYGNHVVMGNSTFINKGKTKNKYSMYARGIPYVSHNPQLDNIVVEVYQVNDQNRLNSIDRLEGHPNFYTREKTTIILDNNEEIDAWLYFHDISEDRQNNLELVNNGDYKNYR